MPMWQLFGAISLDHYLYPIGIKVSNWNKPDDIKNTFATADLLGNNSSRVIFNIGGKNID